MIEPFSLSLNGVESLLLVLGFRGREAMNTLCSSSMVAAAS